MSKVIEGIHVLTYEEWKKKPEVAEQLSAADDCLTCDGIGEHECECGDTHMCNDCLGSGKDTTTNFRFEYENALRIELEKLIAWRNGDPLRHPTPAVPYESNSMYPAILLRIPGEK